MKRIVLLVALFTVVFGAIALGQQTTYTMYTGETKGMHVPTFFTTMAACDSAKEFKYYEPRDITRLGAWQEKLEHGAAGVISFPFPICAHAQTALGWQFIKLPPNTPLFTVNKQVKADGRCGNDLDEVSLPPQPEPPAPPPPPVVVRTPEPEPEAPAPLPPPPVVEQPKHTCPTCNMEVEINLKAKVVKFTSNTSEYLSGEWSIDGKVFDRGNDATISYARLLKLAGKGEKEVVFKARDNQGHEVICKTMITLEKGKKGRFWLFKIPVLNCFYAYTVDIKNWSVSGTIEKAACAALGVGTWYTLTHGGVAALIGSKSPIRVISPP